MKSVQDLGDLKGKRVLIRCDFNVPLDGDTITDDGRIRAALPTLTQLKDAGAKVIVLAHLGRPKGAPEAKYSVAPAAKRLGELIGAEVELASDTAGPGAEETVAGLADGEIALLENVRFEPGETSKVDAEREALAQKWAALADVFVSDGFGVVHRKQASVYDLAELVPSAAGLLIEKEVDVLDRLTENPERPYAVVLGGSKVSDKLGVIEHLLPRVDKLLVGGGMMFTFLAADGHKIGKSLLEADQIETVKGYVREAAERGVQLVLPVDAVMAASFSEDAEHVVAGAAQLEDTEFGADGIGLDIGPRTAETFADVIRSSRTVFWNGPMGVFELAPFAAGTKAVAQALTDVDGLSVVGGGDSAAAVRQLGFADDEFGHISTGGGASLEFLEGKKLPGLEVLGWSQ